jgi:hypothetical protein
VVGIILAAVSALANFALIPYRPFGSLTVIALDIFVIWVLAAQILLGGRVRLRLLVVGAVLVEDRGRPGQLIRASRR